MRPLSNEFLISNTDRNACMHEDFRKAGAQKVDILISMEQAAMKN